MINNFRLFLCIYLICINELFSNIIFLGEPQTYLDRRNTSLQGHTRGKDYIYNLVEGFQPNNNHVFLPHQNKKVYIDGYFDESIWENEPSFMESFKQTNSGTSLPTIILARKDKKLYVAFQIPESQVKSPEEAKLTLAFKNQFRPHSIKYNIYLNGQKDVSMYNHKMKINTGKRYLGLLKHEITKEDGYYSIEIELLIDFLQIKNIPGFTLNFFSKFTTDSDQYHYPFARTPSMNEAPFLTLGTEEEKNKYLDQLMYSRNIKLNLYYFNTVPGQAKSRKLKLSITPMPGEKIKNRFFLKLSLLQNKKVLLEKMINPVHGYNYILETYPKKLKPGNYRWLLQSYDGEEIFNSAEQDFKIINAEDPKESPRWKYVPLELSQTFDHHLKTWHYRTGVPFSKGAITSKTPLKLLQGKREVPFQKEVLATWAPKGQPFGDSIKWLGIDFIDHVEANQKTRYILMIGKKAKEPNPIDIFEDKNKIKINNGILDVTINKANKKKGFNLFQSVTYNKKLIYTAGQNHGPYIHNENGQLFLASMDATAKVEIEKRGPLTAIIKAEGWFVNPNVDTSVEFKEPLPRPKGGFCRFITRITIAHSQPDIKVQHTFILTEDSWKTKYGAIGCSFPTSGTNFLFDHHELDNNSLQQVSLVQKDYHNYELLSINNNQVLMKGEHSKGLFQNENFYLKVKDFSKNYPKEIEYQKESESLFLHLWPKHGSPRKESKETIHGSNAYKLPFVHSGNILDFNVPQCLKDDQHESYKKFHRGYMLSSYKANALGISKTHEFLIGFNQDLADSRSHSFEQSPHLMAKSTYIESTRILGSILSSDPNTFPIMEHYVNQGYKWFLRLQDTLENYGMWNYGDVNHNWYFDRKQEKMMVGYKRLWAATHHGYMRTPWWLYFRSGDPSFLKQARAQTSHIADIDISHWSNSLFSSKENVAKYIATKYPDNTSGSAAHKKIGGLCDYKGYVHWHAGGRKNYNAAIDFLLFDYYLTGNLRSWDVAMEHAHYVWKNLGKAYGRRGSGPADTLIDFYTATWREDVGRSLHKFIRRLIAHPQEKHIGLLLWSPWFRKYMELTEDPEVSTYLVNYAKYYNHMSPRILGPLFDLTGDPQLAKTAAKSILLNSISTYQSNDKNNGMFGKSYRGWTYNAREMILISKAAKTYSLSMPDLFDNEWPRFKGMGIYGPTLSKRYNKTDYQNTYPWPEDTTLQRQTYFIYHSGNKTPIRMGTIQQSENVTIKLVGTKEQLINEKSSKGKFWIIRQADQIKKLKTIGTTRKRKILKQSKYTTQKAYWDFMASVINLDSKYPKGFYKLIYEGTQFNCVPPQSTRSKFWVKVGKASVASYDGFKYFYVPKDCKDFKISFLPTYTKKRFQNKLKPATANILAPDLKVIAVAHCGNKWTPDTLSIHVKPKYRGKVWCISGQGYAISSMEGIPPYLAPSMKAFDQKPYTPPF